MDPDGCRRRWQVDSGKLAASTKLPPVPYALTIVSPRGTWALVVAKSDHLLLSLWTTRDPRCLRRLRADQ